MKVVNNKLLLIVGLINFILVHNLNANNLSLQTSNFNSVKALNSAANKASTNVEVKSNLNKFGISLGIESHLGMLSLFSLQLTKLNVKNLSGLNPVQLSSDEIGNGPIFCEGWNKFLSNEFGKNPGKKI